MMRMVASALGFKGISCAFDCKMLEFTISKMKVVVKYG